MVKAVKRRPDKFMPRTCQKCGVVFLARIHEVNRGYGKFCSASCRSSYVSSHCINQAGEHNGNWKGGVSKDNCRYTKRFREKHREKHLAQCKARYALRSGKLVPQPCADCGKPSACKHHEDYSKPLEVTWLCDVCHRVRHGARREAFKP